MNHIQLPNADYSSWFLPTVHQSSNHELCLTSLHSILHKNNLLETCCHFRALLGSHRPKGKRSQLFSLVCKAPHSVAFPCLQPNSHLPPWQTLCLTQTINPLTLPSPLGNFLPSPTLSRLLFAYTKSSVGSPGKPAHQGSLSPHISSWQALGLVGACHCLCLVGTSNVCLVLPPVLILNVTLTAADTEEVSLNKHVWNLWHGNSTLTDGLVYLSPTSFSELSFRLK